MTLLAFTAAILASFGWASGALLAETPARRLGSLEFTRIQMVFCAALITVIAAATGQWHGTAWELWPSFLASTLVGTICGNLAMAACLRRGGAQITELVLMSKVPFAAGIGWVLLGETLTPRETLGAGIVLAGLALAIGLPDAAKARAPRAAVIFGLIAASTYAFGYVILKPALLAGTSPLAVSGIRLMIEAHIVSLIALWPTPDAPRTPLTPRLLGQTLLPGTIAYVGSASLLMFALTHAPSGLALLLGALSPLFVLPLAWLRDGTRPSKPALLGTVLALLGAGLILL